MSLLARRLHIELRTHGCLVHRLKGWPWDGRAQAELLASGAGRGAQALGRALDGLQQASGPEYGLGAALPRAARLVIADEYVDYLVIDGRQFSRSDEAQALAHARHAFADLLDHENSLVTVTPLAGADAWLCAAIDRDEHATWARVLRAHGVQLTHVHPALLDDLHTLARERMEPDAILIFQRDEGLMMVRLEGGCPRHLQWQPLDPDQSEIVHLKIHEFARATAPVRRGGLRAVVYLTARSRARCRFVLQPAKPPGSRQVAVADCGVAHITAAPSHRMAA